jgi:glycosyltransferase involved in cell wall biosynthesis
VPRALSLVLPTLEEELLEPALEQLSIVTMALPETRTEILVVDDSDPALRERISSWSATWSQREGHPSVRVLEGPRRGKGAAVRIGALASTGDVVFVMDADLPVSLDRVGDFIARLDATGSDIVIAERPMDAHTGDPLRFVLSRGLFVFQWLVVFNENLFADTQCGFKAFRGNVLRRMAAQQIVDGGMYDVEYLYIAVRQGLRIERVPVVPNPETRPSKIDVRRAMTQDPEELVRVKWRGITGGYKPVR